tara:strand:+ start:169 stop:447 length:279 start_codon:yes stop_codon:yes gene_type:complete
MNIHEIIPSYISFNNILISSYEDIVDTTLRMIREKHVFVIDRDLLRCILEDLVYMYCPGDDLNRDRVINMLAPSDDEDDDEDDDENNIIPPP